MTRNRASAKSAGTRTETAAAAYLAEHVVCEIMNGSGQRVNASRTLTRSLDSTEEGLAMKATHDPFHSRPCIGCGRPTPRQSIGQPRKWCSDLCRSESRNAARRSPRIVRPPATRVREKLVESDSGCLEFSGYRNASGYGVIQTGGNQVTRTRLAHRLIWEEANGPISDGLCVRHSCDNPACCNLKHLSLGTHAENMADRDARGRTLKGAALRKARWGR